MADSLLVDAARQGDLEQVRTLLIEGRDVNEEDEYGYTSLIVASMNGYLTIVSLLIEYGATINYQNKDGYTAIYFAVGKNHHSIISLLIESGADLNIKSKDGTTPLMMSAICGYYSIFSLLLNSGSDPSLLNNDGKTALDMASRFNRSDCVVILQNYQHFHCYRKVWLSFSTSLNSFQENQNQESKETHNQIQSPSLMRVMDSSDLLIVSFKHSLLSIHPPSPSLDRPTKRNHILSTYTTIEPSSLEVETRNSNNSNSTRRSTNSLS